MKIHALVVLLLSASLASNCMEKENSTATVIRYDDSGISITRHRKENVIGLMPAFQDTKLTAKAQERASLVPQVPFSINEKTMEELQTINRKITELDLRLNAAKANSSNDPFTPMEIQAKLKKRYEKLGNTLNLLNNEIMQNSTDVLDNVTKEITSQESVLVNKLRDNQITKDEYNSQLKQIKDSFRKSQVNTTIINEFILAHKKVQAIQQFAEIGLTKNKSDKLFIAMETKYRIQAGHLAALINKFVETLEELPQEQTSDK